MRMETNTERYDGFEQIFDGVQECPVDTEYTCRITVRISRRF